MINQVTVIAGRSLKLGEKVEVYYNINKGGFSIKSKEKTNAHYNKVVAYAPFIQIKDASFHVGTKTLERVRTRKQKEVYAVVRGILTSFDQLNDIGYRKGYHNPYITDTFIDWETKQELKTAENVYFYEKYFSFK